MCESYGMDLTASDHGCCGRNAVQGASEVLGNPEARRDVRGRFVYTCPAATYARGAGLPSTKVAVGDRQEHADQQPWDLLVVEEPVSRLCV